MPATSDGTDSRNNDDEVTREERMFPSTFPATAWSRRTPEVKKSRYNFPPNRQIAPGDYFTMAVIIDEIPL